MTDKLKQLEKLALKIRDEVYVNPYSQEGSCMFEERETDGALCICFPAFYIALTPSGTWEECEYDE